MCKKIQNTLQKGKVFNLSKKVFMKLVPVCPIVLMIQKNGLDRKNVYTLTRNTQKNQLESLDF